MSQLAAKKSSWLSAGRGAILPLATPAARHADGRAGPGRPCSTSASSRNIMISLAVLMVALNAAKPLDFSSFPTVLLFATLLRLALNVASTRVVLVHGHEGAGAAGHVIEAFGSFLIGGDYAVGIFVFVDPDDHQPGRDHQGRRPRLRSLGALHPRRHARQADGDRRRSQRRPAHPRGSQGAPPGSRDRGRFLRLDGRCLQVREGRRDRRRADPGRQRHRRPDPRHRSATACRSATPRPDYILLAIGDALVAQVPALLLSIAAAVDRHPRRLAARSCPARSPASSASPSAWMPVAGILCILGLLPGMPHFDHPARRRRSPASIAWKLRKSRPKPQARRRRARERRRRSPTQRDRLGRGQRTMPRSASSSAMAWSAWSTSARARR